jgi:hypothetical protein
MLFGIIKTKKKKTNGKKGTGKDSQNLKTVSPSLSQEETERRYFDDARFRSEEAMERFERITSKVDEIFTPLETLLGATIPAVAFESPEELRLFLAKYNYRISSSRAKYLWEKNYKKDGNKSKKGVKEKAYKKDELEKELLKAERKVTKKKFGEEFADEVYETKKEAIREAKKNFETLANLKPGDFLPEEEKISKSILFTIPSKEEKKVEVEVVRVKEEEPEKPKEKVKPPKVNPKFDPEPETETAVVVSPVPRKEDAEDNGEFNEEIPLFKELPHDIQSLVKTLQNVDKDNLTEDDITNYMQLLSSLSNGAGIMATTNGMPSMIMTPDVARTLIQNDELLVNLIGQAKAES